MIDNDVIKIKKQKASYLYNLKENVCSIITIFKVKIQKRGAYYQCFKIRNSIVFPFRNDVHVTLSELFKRVCRYTLRHGTLMYAINENEKRAEGRVHIIIIPSVQH